MSSVPLFDRRLIDPLKLELSDKKYFKELEFSKDDFHAITWLTSWALSGTHEHELPDCYTSEAIEQLPVQMEDRYVRNLLWCCITFYSSL